MIIPKPGLKNGFRCRAVRLALPLAAFAFGAYLADPARAALVFDQPSQSVPARWNDREVTAMYFFRNDGTETVTIKRMETGCGCTAVKLDKLVYAPGEQGALRMVYTVGGNIGPQNKTAILTTDLATQPSIALAFATDIPDPVAMAPANTIWEQSDLAPKARTITVTVLPGVPLEKLEATAGGTAFTAKLSSVEAGRRYEIEVVPKAGTARPARGDILVMAQTADGQVLRRTVHLILR